MLRVHLMSAGRLRYLKPGAKGPKRPMFRLGFADGGELVLTEAGWKKRAGVWLVTPVRWRRSSRHLGPDALDAGSESLAAILQHEPRQLHPLLRDQRAMAGIGRAHANEILRRAQPVAVQALDRARRPKRSAGSRPRSETTSPRRSSCASKARATRTCTACTTGSASPAPSAARRSRGSTTRSTRSTTARRARPAAACSRTAGSRVCFASECSSPYPRSAMSETRDRVPDVQASAPEVPLALSRAGVTGVHKAIRIRRGSAETVMAAEIECTVDLDRGQKGVHMSRFPELFDEAIDEVVIGEALLVEALAEHIARHIVERQRALRAEVRITARWPVRRTTPVTGLQTQAMVSLIGIAAASESGRRRMVGVEATGINACPCAQGLVRGSAAERLLGGGVRGGRTWSGSSSWCRSRRTTSAGGARSGSAPSHELDAEDLVGIVERSMSAPVYELLKRPDELFVVEHAHLQPRFVEDSVRLALAGAARDVSVPRQRRLPVLAAGEPRDHPRPRRPRGALGHSGRVARRAQRRRRARRRPTDEPRGVALLAARRSDGSRRRLVVTVRLTKTARAALACAHREDAGRFRAASRRPTTSGSASPSRGRRQSEPRTCRTATAELPRTGRRSTPCAPRTVPLPVLATRSA